MADDTGLCKPRQRRRNAIKGTELSEADRALARKFGYKPVFHREFGFLSSFSFAVSISGLFSTVAVTFSYPLAAGGSASAVWCWLISGAGCMCIALSVAEVHPLLSLRDDARLTTRIRLSLPTQRAAASTTPSRG